MACSGTLFWESNGIYLTPGLEFLGVKGHVTIAVAKGLITYKREWTMMDPQPIGGQGAK